VARSAGSAVVRRRLGSALRTLREQSNIRIEAASRAIECSTATISRLENGRGPAKALEVRALLDLYGEQDPKRRAQFEKWASETRSTGWWASDSDLTSEDTERYVAFETEARHVRAYCTPVLPLILQTRRYALAHTRTVHPGLSDADLVRLVDLRLTRQAAILDETVEFGMEAILDEASIRRAVGGAEILAEQLAWLADLIERFEREGRHDLTVRILSFSSGSPARAVSPFAIFTPREPEFDPVTAHVEDAVGSSWYEADDDLAQLEALFSLLRARALSVSDTLAVLRGGPA
jgi:transcriptional regulator with XRE-family HTH domain